MKITTSLAILSLAFPLLCDTARAQQPWEWRTPSVPGQIFPTKEAAAAAMHAFSPALAILTIEQGPEINGSSQQVFTYTAPNVPAEISPWCYSSPFSVICRKDESEAKGDLLRYLREQGNRAMCPAPYIAAETDWMLVYNFVLPPLSQIPQSQIKYLNVVIWDMLYASKVCEEYQKGIFNFTITRTRSFGCQAEQPYKSFYVNNYNSNTGQGDIWSCYYTIKGQVVGTPLLTGCTDGNPCNVRSGDKSETETDYRGPTLSFTRYYHSLAQGTSGELGIGWSHNYSDRLSLNGTGLSGVIFGSGYQVPLLAKQGGTTHYQSSEPPAVEVRKIPEGWALYRENGGRDTFDLQGRLLRREEPSGHRVSIVRDAATGRLQQVRDAAGRALTFERDAATGRLAALTDPAGGRIAFSYAGNRLAQVDFPDASQRRYLYEDARFPHALTGIIDENGQRFSTYTYDALGRAASSEHAGGAGRIGLQYAVSTTSGTVTTTVTDPLNQRRIYYYLSYPPNQVSSVTRQCADCGSGLVRSYSYSGIYPASIRDERGITTTFVYDGIRNLETSRTEASGTAQARTIATQWHPTLRLPATITEPTRRTDFSYDERGNLLARTETALDTGVARTWRYTYDADGNRLSEDGPREDVSDVTTYDYWPADAQCPGAGEGPGMDEGCRGRLRRTTDAAGHAAEHLKYDAHGQLLRRRDPNGAEGVYAYDARGRLTARTEAGLATAYRYDPRGLLDQITLPSGAMLNYQYDAAHRLVGVQDNLGNRVSYTLDAAGNRLTETLTDPSGTLSRHIAREFDALSRVRRETWGAQP